MNINSASQGGLAAFTLSTHPQQASAQQTASPDRLSSNPETKPASPEAKGDSFFSLSSANVKQMDSPPTDKEQLMAMALNRFTEGQQTFLRESGLIEEESFLRLAYHLSDKQLNQLGNVLEGMQTPPAPDAFPPVTQWMKDGDTKAFISNLATLDESTRTRVLEQADTYASRIPKPGAGENIYNASGKLTAIPSSQTAKDLHNFVRSVRWMSDINQMLDNLAAFDEKHHGTLLTVLGRDGELGSQLMNQLVERDDDTQTAMLNLFEELTTSVTRSSDAGKLHLYVNEDKEVQQAFQLDYDNNDATVVWNMIEDSVELMERYSFSDEQLQTMGGQMLELDRSNQRAYLEITKVGLEHLLGSDKMQSIDMGEQEAVMETVDGLRNDRRVRQVVFESRMGTKQFVEGERYYDFKEPGDAARDQQAAIKLFTTDAWLSRQQKDAPDAEMQSLRLANHLRLMGADERDALVRTLNEYAETDDPLTAISGEEAQEQFSDFLNRTSALAISDDLGQLLDSEAQVTPEQHEAFWQVMDASGDQVDRVVDVLRHNSPDLQQQIIDALVTEGERVAAGDKNEQQAALQLNNLITIFEMDLSDSEKSRYLQQNF